EALVGPPQLAGDIAGRGLLVQGMEHALALDSGEARDPRHRPELVQHRRVHNEGWGAVALRHAARKYTTEVGRMLSADSDPQIPGQGLGHQVDPALDWPQQSSPSHDRIETQAGKALRL